MNEQYFQYFKTKMKKLSDIKFDELMKRQEGAVEEDFLKMLKSSSYFRELYFEGYIEGISKARDLKEFGIEIPKR